MVHIFGGPCIMISINFHEWFVSTTSSKSGVVNFLLWHIAHSPVFYASYFGNSYLVITVAILHMGAVYRHNTDAAKDRYNYLLFQTKMNTHPLFPHTRHTPCCNSSCCGTGHVNSLIIHGREPDGVTSCYPILQDGGTNRTKVGQSIFST